MKTPFVIGLTGSIGMGKSTTAGLFQNLGIPVWDADAAVHKLYDHGGGAVEGIATLCPEAVVDGKVDRAVLRSWIASNATGLEQLNSLIHPLVAKDRQDFISKAGESGAELVVVDVPLLFETGGDARVDATVVVTAPAEVQKVRVLERPGMTEDHFKRILSNQMPDQEKRERADFIVFTETMESAEEQVADVVKRIRARIAENA